MTDYSAYPYMPIVDERWALYLYGKGKCEDVLEKLTHINALERCEKYLFIEGTQQDLAYYVEKINDHHVFSGKIHGGYILCDVDNLMKMNFSFIWKELERLRNDEALVGSDINEDIPLISHAYDHFFASKNHVLVDDVTQFDGVIKNRSDKDPYKHRFLGWNAKRKGYKLIVSEII